MATTTKKTRREKIAARAAEYAKKDALALCAARFNKDQDVTQRERHEGERYCREGNAAAAAELLAKNDASRDPSSFQDDK